MKSILIIGAGPAGLTAAYELLKKDPSLKVTIVEASNVIGGISQTYNYKGNRMDIGGHRFFTKDQRVMDLWNEIMPLQGKPSYDDIKLGNEKELAKDGPDPEISDNVMLKRRRVSRIFFLRKFFDYPISLKWSTFKNMGFINTMKAGFGYLWSCIFKKKETNLENFYINRFGKPLYDMFFKDYTTKVWGISPKEISAEWGAQRVKGLSLFKAIWEKISKKKNKEVETSLIEEFYYPKYGPGQLYEALAKKVTDMGATILMNHKVTHIEIKYHKIQFVTCLVDNELKNFTADMYISSMAIKDLYEAFTKSEGNIEAYNIASKLEYRDFITVGLLVPKLLIENKTNIKTIGNIVPDCWIYIQERDVKVGRLQIFNNWSPYMVKDKENTVFIGLEYFANEGDELWNMKDDEFIKFAISELEKIHVIDSKDVIDSCVLKIKKAYPAYFGSYANFDLVKEDLLMYKNLLCIGRNGQHRYNNMDHSIVTSIVAASLCLGEDKYTKYDLWNVNTEKEYHESKK